VRQSQLSFIPGEGILTPAKKVQPIGLQPQIPRCIEFRLIESFNNHRHTKQLEAMQASGK